MNTPALIRTQDQDQHGLAVHEVVLLLQSNPDRGLTGTEARQRLDRFGPNALPAVAGTNPLVRLLRQLNSPLVVILLVAGAVSLLLGEPVDASVIFGVVVVNTLIGFARDVRRRVAMVTRLTWEVRVSDGVVELSAERADADDRHVAAVVAAALPGVRDVRLTDPAPAAGPAG